jgi:aminoglycoside phosphotransferase (APT) family kinase protein
MVQQHDNDGQRSPASHDDGPSSTPTSGVTDTAPNIGDAGPTGIDRSVIDPWFAASVAGAVAPFRYTLIAGGRSNLTYRVDDAAGHAFVLRRPPMGHLLPSAHDMAREHRIIAALHPTAVPVAEAMAFCDDPAIMDRPFYVMRFSEGLILRTLDDANAFPIERRAAVSESLVKVLGDLHSLDVNAVGLGQLGKHEGYIARQLARWHSQFTASKLREVPEVDRVFDKLQARIPVQQGVSIVHGDYRLDNTMIDDDGNVVAVLDWEICTLGDPLADLGVMLVYSPGPEDTNPPLGQAPTMAQGFRSQSEMLEIYAQRSGLDVSNIDFYIAFAFWKLACILDGVYTRYKQGSMGNDGFDFEVYNLQVQSLARRADELLAKG